MSLIDAPMALLDRVLGRRSVAPDDPLVRRIERAVRRLQPDPLYERRLRSTVVNQYVAAREGIGQRHRAPREMGRLGRAVLYASLGVALTATVAGAAAQESLPGDLLYTAKLRLEEIRMEIAPPSVRVDLAAMAVEERLAEVETLAAAGEWARVNSAAPMLDAAVDWLAAFGLPNDAPQLRGVQRHAAVLAELLQDAPAAAQAGIERALSASTGGGSAGERPAGGSPGAPDGTSNDQAQPTKSPKPTQSPKATKSPAPIGSHPAAPQSTAPPTPDAPGAGGGGGGPGGPPSSLPQPSIGP
jgi:hypothetical protein